MFKQRKTLAKKLGTPDNNTAGQKEKLLTAYHNRKQLANAVKTRNL